MTEQAKAFFEENPGVGKVYQVGTDLFLPKFKASADSHAKMYGLEVEEVLNPDRPIEEDEDEFEKVVGAAGDEEEDEQDEDEEDESEEEEVSEPEPVKPPAKKKAVTKKL